AYGLYSPGSNFYFNTRGLGEKYLLGTGNQWYFILPSGAFFHWGGSLSLSAQIATLTPTCYANPGVLCDAEALTDVASTYTLPVGENGTTAGQLNFLESALQTFTGTLHVQATVTDGIAVSSPQSFDVVVMDAGRVTIGDLVWKDVN